MAEIVFELSSSGADAVAASFEDIRVKEHLASEETKRLAAELAKIKQSGQVGAQGIEALTRELVQAQAAQTRLATSARAVQTSQASLSASTAGATRSMRSFHGGSAEMVNMMTEMSLGFGGLSPELREFSVVLASGGNNAVQLSAALGPVAGILTGLGASVLPLVITKVAQWASNTNGATEANRALEEQTKNTTDAIDALVQAMRTRDARERVRSGGGDSGELNTELERSTATLEQLQGQRAALESQLSGYNQRRAEALSRSVSEYQSLERQQTRRTRDLSNLERQIAEQSERVAAATTRATEAMTEALAQGAEDDVEAPQRARRAGRHRDELAERLAREEAFFQELQGLRERYDTEGRRADAAVTLEIERETQRMKREELALEAEQKRARGEQLRIEQRQAADALEKSKEDALEALNSTRNAALEVLTPAIQGISGAIVDVITGAKSADDAFKGLLASFLEMISQKAALEAAGQFASAIASFASQDYGGGAGHLAAGVAWTAVAVAAGAASVAVAPPSAPPASPEQSAPAERGGGGTVVNINGAMVTAGTRAELGRELSNTIAVADRRFGRAA